MQKYPRGSRGSPAKGVVWENRSTSSNLVFCAKKTTDFCRWFFCVVWLVRSGELSRVRANPVREERVFSSVRRFGGVKLCAKRNMLSSAPKRPPIFVGGFFCVEWLVRSGGLSRVRARISGSIFYKPTGQVRVELRF